MTASNSSPLVDAVGEPTSGEGAATEQRLGVVLDAATMAELAPVCDQFYVMPGTTVVTRRCSNVAKWVVTLLCRSCSKVTPGRLTCQADVQIYLGSHTATCGKCLERNPICVVSVAAL